MKKRPESTRPKMPLSQRAKQFAPFDALAGLGGVLKQAEAEHERDLARSTVTYNGEEGRQEVPADSL